jgi:hypothetical protein
MKYTIFLKQLIDFTLNIVLTVLNIIFSYDFSLFNILTSCIEINEKI